MFLHLIDESHLSFLQKDWHSRVFMIASGSDLVGRVLNKGLKIARGHPRPFLS